MKRASTAAASKSKNPNKNKTKVHGKTRDKKFNPLEYLNSLIDEIHEHRFDTVRKRPPPSNRLQRSSALAYATPITDRTASSSKVRSKSSYSQYRKRSVPLRDILRVDIEGAITEEDNYIHFTQETVHSYSHTPPSPPPLPKLTPAAAARRIQRAWRRFQTLKVVRKYYVLYKNSVRREKEGREERRVDRRKEFERTLKIKRSEEVSHNRTLRLTGADPLEEASIITTKQLLREPAEGLHDARTIQLVKQQGLSSEEYTSKDLKFVIDLFRSREETASKEINHQLEAFCQLQAQLSLEEDQQLTPQRTDDITTEGLSPLVFLQMERVTREKYQLLKERLQRNSLSTQQRRAREQQIQGRMRRQLRSIQRCREDYARSITQLKENMLKLQADSSRVERLCQREGKACSVRVRKSYSADTLILKSILQEVALKDLQLDSRAALLLERSEGREEGMYPICPTSPPSGIIAAAVNSQTGCSKGSLGCYEFSDSDRLQEEMQHEFNSSVEHSSPSSQKQLQQFSENQQALSHCDSCSSIQISVKESCGSEAKEDPRNALLRQCAQEMEAQIEECLVDEIVEEVFLNAKMYALFKPYVEHPFEFKQITDADIFAFLNHQLPRFLHPLPQTLARFNQKINPNSLQILRLIRDFDFEIEQYQLVLPEEIFKAYRRSVQQQYAEKIRRELEAPVVVGEVNARVREVVAERGAQRRQKRGKFMRFERDLKIMYMKSVFNCYNQLIIETKSFYTFMNGRSSIGPGELTLALREYNIECDAQQCLCILEEAREKVQRVVRGKAMLPIFRSYKQVEQFQRQVTRQISGQMGEGEFKWVNYMDEVLQIWQELSGEIAGVLLTEAAGELGALWA